MQINSINKKEEPMLSRTMIKANVSFEKATPSYQEITSFISNNLKVDEKLIVIRHIYTSFGNKKADITAYAYSDEAKKQFFEPKAKEKKDKKAKETAKK